MDMNKWKRSLLGSGAKAPIPILSFPSVGLMDITVRELIASADTQAEGMARVAERCPAGAALSMMDLSVEAEAFGCEIRFSDDEVPTVVGCMIEEPEQAEALTVPPVGAGRTGRYIEAIRKAKERIADRPVLAGIIGPFSLAARFTGVSEAMIYCFEEPEMMETLLEKATEFIIAYALAYRGAGADGVVMAEPAAGLLSPALMGEFSTPYAKKIVEAVQREDFALVYHNCGSTVVYGAEEIASVGAAAYHFGNAVDLAAMLEKMPKAVPVLGNVDPSGVLRHGTPDIVRAETLKVLEACGGYENFVLSTGCDVPPTTPWENIDAFFAAAKEFYEQ